MPPANRPVNVIVPVAGKGSRLRPQTHTRPKPLLHVAGDTMLGHALHPVLDLPIREWVFVVGHHGAQIRRHVEGGPYQPARCVEQRELTGQAGALAAARDSLHGPVLVVFPDMVFDLPLGALTGVTEDGVVFSHAVEDPRRFGVVIAGADGCATAFVEKPAEPVSDQAVVGVYYVRDGRWLLDAVDRLLDSGEVTRGEYYLADALGLMIEDGARLAVWPAKAWHDCGTVPDLLATHGTLLGHIDDSGHEAGAGNTVSPPVRVAPGAIVERCVLGPGVIVGPGCVLRDSTVGPNVSLERDVVMEASRLKDVIVSAGARIHGATLTDSLVGQRARVRGFEGHANVGDDAVVTGRGVVQTA